MNSKSYGIHKKAQGQSLLEFALILPLLVLVLVGVFDLGRALFALITINNAAREGARYGTLNPNDRLGMRLASLDETQGSNIEITCPDPTNEYTCNVVVSCTDSDVDGSCDRGTAIRVTVNYDFTSILNMFIPATIHMHRFTEMAVP